MNTYHFKLLDPGDRNPQRRDALAERSLPETLSSHQEAARHYQPDDDLIDAVNVALAVGAPLLLTGEPGTGKTQVAYFLAWYFELDTEKQPFTLSVRSTTTADDLLYHFDAVAYLHAAHDPERSGKPLDRAEFIKPGPLWQAYECEGPAVVLIDEVDKAPRDFPNDILREIENMSFKIMETGEVVTADPS
ncbi:MAG: AAA family ATPase, partial [Leptospiraceae bacterium]|nr:AAA family ATPase [Leptospiraceae bacterium]